MDVQLLTISSSLHMPLELMLNQIQCIDGKRVVNKICTLSQPPALLAAQRRGCVGSSARLTASGSRTETPPPLNLHSCMPVLESREIGACVQQLVVNSLRSINAVAVDLEQEPGKRSMSPVSTFELLRPAKYLMTFFFFSFFFLQFPPILV